MLAFDFVDNHIHAFLPDGQCFWTLYPVELAPGYISHNIQWEIESDIKAYYQPLNCYRERPASISHLPHDVAHCIALNVNPIPTDRFLVRHDLTSILVNEAQYFGSYLALIIKQYDDGFYFDVEQRNSFHVDVVRYQRLHQAMIIVNAVLRAHGSTISDMATMASMIEVALTAFGLNTFDDQFDQNSLYDVIAYLPSEQWGRSSISINNTETQIFI